MATVFVTEPADWIDVPFRVDDAVALKLAMHAHDKGVTLNELMIAILTDMLSTPCVIRSRAAREGRYAGRIGSYHVRSSEASQPASRIAAAILKQRLEKKLAQILEQLEHGKTEE